MKKIIYIEKSIQDEARVNKILSKYKDAKIILIEKYTEVFNKNNQHFNMQKKNPSIILAKKQGNFINTTPSKYTIGNNKNYYFSYMYNCLFNCKYCFLQGLYKSANFVIFINYEDFFENIKEISNKEQKEKITFFSGYDCDSLAYNNQTQFIEEAINFFKLLNNAELEIRTKSSLITPFLSNSVENIIIAYSFTPSRFSQKYEAGVPHLEKRLNSIKKLVKLGWNIGIRFDPIVIYENWQSDYQKLFKKIFNVIPEKQIHSVTYGKMRFPKYIFKRIEKNNSREPLFFNLKIQNNLYEQHSKYKIEEFCETNLQKYTGTEKIFSNL